MRRRLLLFAAALPWLAVPAAAYEFSTTLHVSEAHAVATVPGQPDSAAYLTIHNDGAATETLVGAESPVALSIEILVTETENGVTRLRPLPGIEIAPANEVLFAPGGKYLRLVGLKAPLRVGGIVRVDLTFASGAHVVVDMGVRDAASHGR